MSLWSAKRQKIRKTAHTSCIFSCASTMLFARLNCICMVCRYIYSHMRFVDTAKNTEADLLIPGNILHAGVNIISYNTTHDKLSQEIQQNLLISTTTNETDYDCKFGTWHLAHIVESNHHLR